MAIKSADNGDLIYGNGSTMKRNIIDIIKLITKQRGNGVTI